MWHGYTIKVKQRIVWRFYLHLHTNKEVRRSNQIVANKNFPSKENISDISFLIFAFENCSSKKKFTRTRKGNIVTTTLIYANSISGA